MAITIAASSVLMFGCDLFDGSNDSINAAFLPEEPEALNVIGTSLNCETAAPTSTLAAGLFVEEPDSTPPMNLSRDTVSNSELHPNAGNVLKRLTAIVPGQTPDGSVAVDDLGAPIGDVHPILVSYAEQVIGAYELGDGSADIGDPTTLDDVFTSLSMDNGATWKKVTVGDTSGKSSITVKWNGLSQSYGGHSHKPQMGVEGKNILVAWNDKYCPSGNPFDLDLEADPEADYFKVNGSQGSIDYEGIIAPNDKPLYEVPFSCVWTARGEFVLDPEGDGSTQYTIQWRQAQQMTTGTRDSNKIWIAAEDVGFAMAWQEDTQGLRSGKGAGPGEGYSGATTNHGTDIWYTYINMVDFDDVVVSKDADGTITEVNTDPTPADILALGEKPKPAVNYAYPTRISNNESCSSVDEKVYCADHCFATVSIDTGNQSGTAVDRCVDDDLDYMTDDASIPVTAAVLDGDTGASRPALKILRTDAPLDAEDKAEYVAILAYEETKGLSESSQGSQDQGTVDPVIALEGKAVYFESFFWDQPVEVSAGRVVNLHVPDVDIAYDDSNVITSINETGLDVYENARRVVIMGQVDACEMQEGDYTFGLLYKQGFDTRGGPSDMYIRMNKGFVYEDFEDTTSNVSARETVYDAEGKVTSISWAEEDLLDQSYDNPLDNTFSPRGWVRGSEIYTGFEYTPNWRMTENGTTPNNFWMHSYTDAVWNGPKQITFVKGAKVSTLDPRFVPTPEGRAAGVAGGIASDASNPDVLFISYGTFDMDSGEELDIFYSRSTDKGLTWEYQDGTDTNTTVLIPGIDGIDGTVDDAYRHAKLAHKAPDIEKEVQALGSPDGTMLFNVWMREIHDGDYLESEFGLVNYDTAAP